MARPREVLQAHENLGLTPSSSPVAMVMTIMIVEIQSGTVGRAIAMPISQRQTAPCLSSRVGISSAQYVSSARSNADLGTHHPRDIDTMVSTRSRGMEKCSALKDVGFGNLS